MNDIIDWTLAYYGEATYKKNEMYALAAAAIEVPKGGTMVELGTYAGCSASILIPIAMSRAASLTMCDSHMWMWDEGTEAKFNQMLKERGANGTIQLRVTTSENCNKLWRERPIDFIHIDGDHSADGVRKDCTLWLPLLKSGGMACFHDYRGNIPNIFKELPEIVDTYTGDWPTIWHGGDFGLLVRQKP